MRIIKTDNYVRCACADKNNMDIPETSFCKSVCLNPGKSRLTKLCEDRFYNLITHGELVESLTLELGYPPHLAEHIASASNPYHIDGDVL